VTGERKGYFYMPTDLNGEFAKEQRVESRSSTRGDPGVGDHQKLRGPPGEMIFDEVL